MRPAILRLILVSVVIFSPALPVQGQGGIETYAEVLRRAAEDAGIGGDLQQDGAEGDEIVTMTIAGPGSSVGEGVSLTCTVYSSRAVKKGFLALAKAFGEGSKKVYGAPPVQEGTISIDGVRVKVTDCAAYTTKGGPIITSIPRTRTASVEPKPTLVFKVTTMGGPDPEPAARALIAHLEEAGLFGPVEEGVRFKVVASADGFSPAEREVDTNDVSPSSITVGGRVVDESGEAVAGAEVSIPSLGISTISDESGAFTLSAATEGSTPFNTTLNLTLKRIPSGIRIVFEHPDHLPLPGAAEIVVRAEEGDGKAVDGGVVSLSWSGSEVLDNPPSAGTLDSSGSLRVPLSLQVPEDLQSVKTGPDGLGLRLDVAVTPVGGGGPVEAGRDLPLNAALIVGRTVGPDMQPRPETEAPRVLGVAPSMVLARIHDEEGGFRILVVPTHPRTGKSPAEWRLAWGPDDRLPLEWTLPAAPTAGAVTDVGSIDVLTPEEHNERLRSVVAEFGAAMPLTPDQQRGLQAALQKVIFTDGSTAEVPFYQDNRTDDSGSVHIPGRAADYYGANFRVGEDPAYPIMFHELGHFMHHHLVERYSYINFCYQKLAGGSHDTWSMEPGMTALRSEYVSFSENTADFFAGLVWTFWLERHPEMRDSIYVRRPNYLAEFETDEKAMAALEAGSPGLMVEGIQTRFLHVFYGRAAQRRSTQVFDDYLNTMLLYMDRPTGFFEGLVNRPARKIHQWIDAKRRLPGAFGPADPMPLATRYRLIPGADPMPTASAPWGNLPPVDVRLDGRLVDFLRFPVIAVPEGSRLTIGPGRLSLDLSTVQRRQTAILEAESEIVLTSRTEMVIHGGSVSVDFPITIRTPGGSVLPQGTVVRVEVVDGGDARVQTLEGSVLVKGASGVSHILEAGKAIDLTADGDLGVEDTYDVEALRRFLMPEGELPPLPEPRGALDLSGTDLRERISTMPWWALLAGSIAVVAVVVILIWLLRRFLVALVAAPFLAGVLAAIGYLVLRPPLSGDLGFVRLLVSPLEAWSVEHFWVPAAAWFVAGLAAGLIVRGPFRGLLTGALAPLVPWMVVERFNPMRIVDDPAATLAALAADPDLVALLVLATAGGALGGLLLPHRRRKYSPPRPRGGGRRAQRDDGWDWDGDDE